MAPLPNSSYPLVNAHGQTLGTVFIEQVQGNQVMGLFSPGPAFATVQGLFRQFEEAVNVQALSVVEQIDTAIAALGLQLGTTNATGSVAIRDVQIWSDGGFSCQIPQVVSQEPGVAINQAAYSG